MLSLPAGSAPLASRAASSAGSAATSASTAFIAAAAPGLMSGLRFSKPRVFSTSSGDEWMRAIRYSHVATHVAACAALLVVSSRSRGSGRPPLRRRVTS